MAKSRSKYVQGEITKHCFKRAKTRLFRVYLLECGMTDLTFQEWIHMTAVEVCDKIPVSQRMCNNVAVDHKECRWIIDYSGMHPQILTVYIPIYNQKVPLVNVVKSKQRRLVGKRNK